MKTAFFLLLHNAFFSGSMDELFRILWPFGVHDVVAPTLKLIAQYIRLSL
jgi:hypothetical protein